MPSDTPNFTRTTENFVCDHCGHEVIGNGYTNHCPACLWSKHVDIHPGDRASTCRGLMQPVSVTQKNGEQRLLHRCVLCGHEKNNVVAANDSVDALIAVSAATE